MNNIELYVHRVFLKDDCDELMPERLNMVKSIVDPDDMHFSISHETMQHNKIMQALFNGFLYYAISFLTECFKDADTDRDEFNNTDEFDLLVGKAAAMPHRYGIAPS